MRNPLKQALAGLVAAGLLLSAAGCAGSDAERASSDEVIRGGTIAVAISPPDKAPEPLTVVSSGEINVIQPVVEYLLFVEQDGTLSPRLATEHAVSEDGLEWTFTLREGVQFHDGTPFTSADVVATFDRILAEDSLASAHNDFIGILSAGGVQADGDYTVRFTLDQPFAEFPVLVSSGNVGTGILKADYDGDFIGNPIGTGPFTLDAYTPDANAGFSRFEEYWNADEVYLDGIDMQFFEEPSADAIALQTGNVDLIYSVNYMQHSQLFDSPDIEVLAATVSGGVFVQMRNDVEPWNDKRVRQAFAHAVNRAEQAQLLVGDQTAIGNDGIWTAQFPEQVDVAPREHDPERARELLAEAGYPDGIQATLTIPDNVSPIAELLQSQVAEAGFDLELEVMDGGTYYGDPWLSVPLGISVWATRPSVSQLVSLLYKSDSPWNTSHWSNPEFDALADELSVTVDQGERDAIAQQMDELLFEEVPLVRAVNNTSNQAHSKAVRDYKASPYLHMDFVGVWLDR